MTDEPAETFYSEERWQNWLTRVEDEDLDPESEEFARLYFNLQNDTTIAIAKVISAADDGRVDEETTLEKLGFINEIVMAEPDFDGEEELLLIDSVQTSLVPVFYAAEEYVIGGPVEEYSIQECIDAAIAAAGDEEDVDAALAYLVQAGTQIIDGEKFDGTQVDEIDSWIVSEWLNGLDSLQDAFADPEVIDEE
ncbi:MAG: DUF2150 family protein [Halohasta sp.]